MTQTPRNTYKNTCRTAVISFFQSLSLTAQEAEYLGPILAKPSYSNRDLKALIDLIAHRAAQRPLSGDAIAALGLPSLPLSTASQRRSEALEGAQ